jgi:hypothetical protein
MADNAVVGLYQQVQLGHYLKYGVQVVTAAVLVAVWDHCTDQVRGNMVENFYKLLPVTFFVSVLLVLVVEHVHAAELVDFHLMFFVGQVAEM